MSSSSDEKSVPMTESRLSPERIAEIREGVATVSNYFARRDLLQLLAHISSLEAGGAGARNAVLEDVVKAIYEIGDGEDYHVKDWAKLIRALKSATPAPQVSSAGREAQVQLEAVKEGE
jgi:hypothetical protein